MKRFLRSQDGSAEQDDILHQESPTSDPGANAPGVSEEKRESREEDDDAGKTPNSRCSWRETPKRDEDPGDDLEKPEGVRHP